MSEAQDKLQKEIFLGALDKAPGTERESYLAQTCGQDTALRERVDALLLESARACGFLEHSVPGDFESLKRAVLGGIESVGDQIGPYKLLRQLGEGGCGVVYLAQQREPIRRRVAFKVIKLGMDTRQVIARFEAERQALALMDHPNIAKVFDAGATQTGRPYFVMELVRGIRITDYCDQNQLAVEDRLDLFVQICHAIQHAHQKGIIHRDIKPSNILVEQADGQTVAKVIDFGVAKATGGAILTDKTVFTAFEQFIGTPAYMSPEQATMTSLDIDTRSDIYALGVLLYELLTGRTPFEHKELLALGLEQMRHIIGEKEPARPSTRLSALNEDEKTSVAQRRRVEVPQLIHSVRGDLDWIVMKCLEKNRSRRYATANGVAEDISRHLRDEPVSARPPGRMYRFQKLVQRNKVIFAAGAAVLAALLIGLGFSTWLFFRERSARSRAVFAEGIQVQLRQRAEAEARKSQHVAQFLKDMLAGVGPWVALGRDTTLLKEILNKTAERVGKDLRDQPEVQAELLSTLGDTYLDLGQRTNGAAMHRGALQLRRNIYGEFNTNVANSLDGIGRAFLWQDNADEAEAYLQKAFMIRTNLLGLDNLQVADSLARLGRLRFLQGRPSEGEPLYRRCLELRRKFLGTNNAHVIGALEGLCLCLRDQDRLGEAEKVAREMVEIQARLSGAESSIETAVMQAGLADIFVQQNRMAEAEVPARENWLACRRVFGEDSFQAIQAAVGYFIVLGANGKSPEALALARETAALSKKAFPTGYPTCYCLASAADVFRNAGLLDEAEKTYREAVSAYEQLAYRGEREAWTRVCLCNLLQAEGKDDEIESYLNDNLIAQRRIFTPAAREREADLLNQMAIRRKAQGRPSDAQALYYDALGILNRRFTNGSPVRSRVAAELVDLLKEHGKLKEAEAIHRQSVALARQLNVPSDLARALGDLAGVLREQGRTAEAEATYVDAVALYRKTGMSNWPQGFAGLAVVLADRGRLDLASSYVLEAITNVAPGFEGEGQMGMLINLFGQKLRAPDAVNMFKHLAASAQIPAGAQYPFGNVAGAVLGRLGEYKLAVPYQTQVLTLATNNALLFVCLAAELAYAGDSETYCCAFREALKLFSGSTDAAACEPLAKAFSLLPSVSIDRTQVDRWAKITAGRVPDALNLWAKETLRLVHYRNGRFADVIQDEDSLGFGTDAVPERETTTRCILAMSHYRLSQIEKAKAELTKAVELSRTKLKRLGMGELGLVWPEWYIAQVMLREAKTLIGVEGTMEPPSPAQSGD